MRKAKRKGGLTPNDPRKAMSSKGTGRTPNHPIMGSGRSKRRSRSRY